ncbi:hypothetical protein CC79DRAFT_1366100 [Sarocladium strictum]
MARKRKTPAGAYRQISPQDRWCCIDCHLWKQTGEFSSGQLNIVIKDPTLEPGTCFMKCIACAGGREQKIRCEAACGEMKPASAFSKTSRRAQIWKCEACIALERLQEAYIPVIEKKDLEKMVLAHDPATEMAGDYMNEPAGRPQGSMWDLAKAAAASSCGEDMSNYASDVASTRSATSVPSAPGRSMNHWGPSGRYDGWKVHSDASSTASQATESASLSDFDKPDALQYGQLRRAKPSSVAWSSASTAQGRDLAEPILDRSSSTRSVTPSPPPLGRSFNHWVQESP